MAYYALIQTSTSTVQDVVDGDAQFRSGTLPILLPGKDLHWLPFVKVDPDVDHDTQIKTGPVDVVSKTKVTRTWTVKSKTAQELDDRKNALAESAIQGFKALMRAINDGTFVPGQNLTDNQMKQIIKDHI
jgi:hypothetical protein